jgi:restriction endonuclease S subunit
LKYKKKIVAEIENYQKIIDGCKQIIDSWKPNIERYLRKELKNYLANHPELKNELQDGWNMVKLGEVCEVNPKKSELKGKNFEISFVPMADVNEQNYYFEPKQTKKLIEVYNGYNYFAENDVIIAKITPCFENGKSAIVKNLKNGIGFGSTEFIVLRARSVTIPEWIYWFVSDSKFINEGKNHMSGSAGQKRLSIDFVREYKIPLPPIEVQQKIVEEINKEEEALEKIKLLKANAEKRIEEVIDEVWGEKNE